MSTLDEIALSQMTEKDRFLHTQTPPFSTVGNRKGVSLHTKKRPRLESVWMSVRIAESRVERLAVVGRSEPGYGCTYVHLCLEEKDSSQGRGNNGGH